MNPMLGYGPALVAAAVISAVAAVLSVAFFLYRVRKYGAGDQRRVFVQLALSSLLFLGLCAALFTIWTYWVL